MNTSYCVEEIISIIEDNSTKTKLMKASISIILGVEFFFLILLINYTYKLVLTKQRPSWFTLMLTTLLYLYVIITVFDCSIMLRAANSEDILEYPDQKNFAQLMAID